MEEISRKKVLRNLALLAITGALLGNNFIVDGVASRTTALLVGRSLGTCFAQLNLISVGAAISQGPLIVRLPWAYFLVAVIWISHVLGISSSQGDSGSNSDQYFYEMSFQIGVVLMVCLTVAQIPLGIASRGFGWQLQAPTPEARVDEHQRGQFQRRPIFIGTIFLALTLALIRSLFADASCCNLVFEQS